MLELRTVFILFGLTIFCARPSRPTRIRTSHGLGRLESGFERDRLEPLEHFGGKRFFGAEMIGKRPVRSTGRGADVAHACSSVTRAEHDAKAGAQDIIAKRWPAHFHLIRSYVLTGQEIFLALFTRSQGNR